MAKAKKTKTIRETLSKREKKQAYINVSKKVYRGFLDGAISDSLTNFEYTITVNGVTVSLLDINGTVVSPIKASGKIDADKGKPFYIEVRAQLNSPTGNGSLQLKDLVKNKDVFDKPQEFRFPSSSNGGLFLEDVKLP